MGLWRGISFKLMISWWLGKVVLKGIFDHPSACGGGSCRLNSHELRPLQLQLKIPICFYFTVDKICARSWLVPDD